MGPHGASHTHLKLRVDEGERCSALCGPEASATDIGHVVHIGGVDDACQASDALKLQDRTHTHTHTRTRTSDDIS